MGLDYAAHNGTVAHFKLCTGKWNAVMNRVSYSIARKYRWGFYRLPSLYCPHLNQRLPLYLCLMVGPFTTTDLQLANIVTSNTLNLSASKAGFLTRHITAAAAPAWYGKVTHQNGRCESFNGKESFDIKYCTFIMASGRSLGNLLISVTETSKCILSRSQVNY